MAEGGLRLGVHQRSIVVLNARLQCGQSAIRDVGQGNGFIPVGDHQRASIIEVVESIIRSVYVGLVVLDQDGVCIGIDGRLERRMEDEVFVAIDTIAHLLLDGLLGQGRIPHADFVQLAREECRVIIRRLTGFSIDASIDAFLLCSMERGTVVQSISSIVTIAINGGWDTIEHGPAQKAVILGELHTPSHKRVSTEGVDGGISICIEVHSAHIMTGLDSRNDSILRSE